MLTPLNICSSFILAIASFVYAFKGGLVAHGLFEYIVQRLFFLLPIVIILSIVQSYRSKTDSSYVWAFLPLIYFFIFIPLVKTTLSLIEDHIRSGRTQEIVALVKDLPRAFTRPNSGNRNDYFENTTDDFLYLDSQTHTLTYIGTSYGMSQLVTTPVGIVKDDKLELFDKLENKIMEVDFTPRNVTHLDWGVQEKEKISLEDFKNAAGQTIFDQYKVTFSGGQNIQIYHLDRFEKYLPHAY